MESLFFNITDTRYKITGLLKENESYIHKVDISNGILFFDAFLIKRSYEIVFQCIDAMVMVVMVKQGRCTLHDHIKEKNQQIKEGKITIFCSTRQNMSITFDNNDTSDVFILCIADFFLKRYLSAKESEPIDFLYSKLQKEISLERISNHPIDAMSLYLVQKILSVAECDTMQSIRAEQRVTEFMILRFSLLDIVNERIAPEDRALAVRAKAILLQDFVSPPSIEKIAHLCATNSSKLKKVFKKVYQMTLHEYIQKLRLEEANLMLKDRQLSIGEIARAVGYKHQGHFSKLFFQNYGVYPKELLKRSGK